MNRIYLKYLEVNKTKNKGRGVFSKKYFKKGETVEICPVIELGDTDAKICQKTILNNYLYDWYDRYNSAIILGYGSIYNHSYTPNARYVFHEKKLQLEYVAIKDIDPGNEITVNYNYKPNDNSPLTDLLDVLTGEKLVVKD